MYCELLISVLYMVALNCSDKSVTNPHNENFEEYRRMCCLRTTKSMIKNRQIQVCHGIYLLIFLQLLLFAVYAIGSGESLGWPH